MMKLDHVQAKPSSGYIGKGVILLSILAGTMIFTNPKREEYLNYASDQLSTEIKKSICQESQVPEFLKGLSNTLVNTCNTLVVTQRDFIKDTINKSTTQQNALLFSVYTTEIMGYKYQTLGGFGNFVTFPTKDPKTSQSASK
ncbi:DUF4359 domain-containing protein [Planktothrix sp. FACHB-1365]|uniref:DUF4359 domain-containing protein n=1 Tax=Planktothrix sp. FACHB-1365 TaxID=2692855 RepID=UPI0016882866|nr:DUF4359 domain-containing protein [Planktothrix sp. FACHB-1365]MBD2481234.1 DUF4359 domain-containing protein [Planktothrix sp. FACHB-1365]